MIDKYDFTIYPCKLWVCTDFEEAKKRFRNQYDNKELEFPVFDYTLSETYGLLKEKSTKEFGFAVVVLSDLKSLGGTKIIEIISHEASHVANRIFDWLGIRLDANNDEPYAYLIGYIASCIWETVSKIIVEPKNKKNGTDKD